MYRIVFPAKYRRAVIDEQVDTVLKEICFRDFGALPIEVFGNWHGQRSRAFFGSVGANLQCDEDCEDGEEPNGARDFPALSSS